MCDFRKITGVKINNLTIPVNGTKGHFYSWDEPGQYTNLEPGIYSIGATGVGQYYYDGQNWYSDYECNWYNYINKCEFIHEGHAFDDYIDENGCLQPDLSDVEIQEEN